VLWAALVVWGSMPAAAQEQEGARVELRGCGALDASPIREALELELGGSEVCAGLRVSIVCEATSTTLEVADPITHKRTTRTLAAVDSSAPDAPRVLALVASELVLASWAELLITPPADEGSLRAEARARVEQEREGIREDAARLDAQVATAARVEHVEGAAAVVPEADTRDEPTAIGSGLRLWVDLDGGVRLRDGSTPFFPPLVALRALAALADDVALGLRASLELGQASRESGSILHSVAGLGLVLTWVCWRAQELALELSTEGRVGWVRLDGRPSRSSVEGRAIDEVLVDVSASIAPTFELGSLRIGVALELGACLVAPTGLVSAGPDLALPGFFGGLTLRIGLR
jgi:hypothetical protein